MIDVDETDVVVPDVDETDVVVPDVDETDVVVPDVDEPDVVPVPVPSDEAPHALISESDAALWFGGEPLMIDIVADTEMPAEP